MKLAETSQIPQNLKYLPLSDDWNYPVIFESDLLGVLYPGYWENCNYTKYSYEETSAKVLAWAKENNFHLYEVPGDEFFVGIGVKQAMDKKCAGVIVNSLS